MRGARDNSIAHCPEFPRRVLVPTESTLNLLNSSINFCKPLARLVYGLLCVFSVIFIRFLQRAFGSSEFFAGFFPRMFNSSQSWGSILVSLLQRTINERRQL